MHGRTLLEASASLSHSAQSAGAANPCRIVPLNKKKYSHAVAK
jgi:hypothetical protein